MCVFVQTFFDNQMICHTEGKNLTKCLPCASQMTHVFNEHVMVETISACALKINGIHVRAKLERDQNVVLDLRNNFLSCKYTHRALIDDTGTFMTLFSDLKVVMSNLSERTPCSITGTRSQQLFIFAHYPQKKTGPIFEQARISEIIYLFFHLKSTVISCSC